MSPCLKPAALLVVSVIVFSSGCANQAESDQAKLQGKWKATSTIKNGVGDVAKPVEYLFAGDTLVAKLGEYSIKGTFKLDASKSPRHISFLSEDGDVGKGIYKIDGDTLTLCGTEGNEPRPMEFKSVVGSKVGLFVFVKAKD